MANEPATAVPRVDNPNAPEVFADDAAGVLWHNGNVRITFESLRANHRVAPASMSRVVVGTLVMPMAAAEAMARMLIAAIEASKTSGATPRAQTLQ